MQLRSNLWLSNSKDGYFGKGRIELLSKISETGSISKAAKEMRMSYKAAWDAVNEMNELSDTPIVERAAGGKGGGGTVLTERGREYIEIFHRIEEAQGAFFDVLGDFADDIEKLKAFTSRSALRTSARNQIEGEVTQVDMSDTGANVVVKVSFGEMRVHITRRSMDELDIQPGKEVTILFKPTWVEVYSSRPSNIDTNIWRGGIVSLDGGEVLIESSGEQLIAIAKGGVVGDEVWLHVSPSSALLAI